MVSAYVCVDVPDVVAATKFYCDALGLERLSDVHSNVRLSAGGMEVYLSLKKAGSAPTPDPSNVRTYDRHWTPVHLDFVVPDVDQAAALVAGAGGVVEHTQSGDWGSIAHCADPFGNGFCLINLS